MSDLDQFVEYKIYLYIFQIFIPVLLGLGTAGNITTIIVLTKPKHRSSSTARFLLALAVSDLLMLWIMSPRLWLICVFGFDFREFSEVACKLHYFLAVWPGQLSVLFIMSVTVERFVCVVLPFKAKFICSLRNANIVIIAFTTWIILTNSHFLFDVGLTEEGKCAQKEEMWNTLALKIVLIVHVTSVAFVPLPIVLVANACIITKLLMRKLTFGKSNTNNGSNASRSAVHKKTSRMTITLILLNLTFLISLIPISAFLLMYGGKQNSYKNEHEDAIILLFWSVSLSIFLTNNAINFVLYFLSGSKFRKEVTDLCCSTIHCC